MTGFKCHQRCIQDKQLCPGKLEPQTQVREWPEESGNRPAHARWAVGGSGIHACGMRATLCPALGHRGQDRWPSAHGGGHPVLPVWRDPWSEAGSLDQERTWWHLYVTGEVCRQRSHKQLSKLLTGKMGEPGKPWMGARHHGLCPQGYYSFVKTMGKKEGGSPW